MEEGVSEGRGLQGRSPLPGTGLGAPFVGRPVPGEPAGSAGHYSEGSWIFHNNEYRFQGTCPGWQRPKRFTYVTWCLQQCCEARLWRPFSRRGN